ncbi:MAG TPA: hypothetical protein DCP63_01405 [Bacteroidetes bacterium]|nr:hypothetical protein [Bacteroidota bacterium]
MLRRGLFEQFAISYLDGAGAQIRSRYSKEFKLFEQSFSISDEVISDFRSFAQKNQVKIDEKDFLKDLAYLKVRLKATIARSFWGNEGWFPLLLTTDTQFQKALSLLPEAEKIARVN